MDIIFNHFHHRTHSMKGTFRVNMGNLIKTVVFRKQSQSNGNKQTIRIQLM